MRTKLAKWLLKFGTFLKYASMRVCDHKMRRKAVLDGYRTNFCWTCGKVGK